LLDNEIIYFLYKFVRWVSSPAHVPDADSTGVELAKSLAGICDQTTEYKIYTIETADYGARSYDVFFSQIWKRSAL